MVILGVRTYPFGLVESQLGTLDSIQVLELLGTQILVIESTAFIVDLAEVLVAIV